MTHFYRYLRPLAYDPRPYGGVKLSPNGGICFRVNEEGMAYGFKILTVSYSICADEIVFNKEVAKKVADTRIGWVIKSQSLGANMIARSMIQFYEDAIAKVPPGRWPDYPHHFYRLNDLQLLKEKILSIWDNHRRAWEQANLNEEIVEALDLLKQYKAHSI